MLIEWDLKIDWMEKILLIYFDDYLFDGFFIVCLWKK